eukprot:TRINITY_DN4626_c2_g1_i2.p1 TRINITY_DN4626_c2_g1~~TRINITY_DN4626_c2_g1_i2.p1  ORF type:complete len:326 (+),score=64.71 TRINITY_DN4626_c2_g1_i2:89-1066(+)
MYSPFSLSLFTKKRKKKTQNKQNKNPLKGAGSQHTMQSGPELMAQLEQRGVDGCQLMTGHITDMQQKLEDRESELGCLKKELVYREAEVKAARDDVANYERDLDTAKKTIVGQQLEQSETVLKKKVDQVNYLLELVEKKTVELDEGKSEVDKMTLALEDRKHIEKEQEHILLQQEVKLTEMLDLIKQQASTLTSFAEQEGGAKEVKTEGTASSTQVLKSLGARADNIKKSIKQQDSSTSSTSSEQCQQHPVAPVDDAALASHPPHEKKLVKPSGESVIKITNISKKNKNTFCFSRKSSLLRCWTLSNSRRARSHHLQSRKAVLRR